MRNIPNEIPAAPALPTYHEGGDPKAAWSESWSLGYLAGWHVTTTELEKAITERNHLVEELANVMEDRDRAEEALATSQGNYKFLAICTTIVTALALVAGIGIGRLFGLMV